MSSECVERIIAAAGGVLNHEQARAIFKEAGDEAKRIRQEASGMRAQALLKERMEANAKQKQIDAARARNSAIRNAIKFDQQDRRIQGLRKAGATSPKAFLTLIHGLWRGMREGTVSSAAADITAARRAFVGGLEARLAQRPDVMAKLFETNWLKREQWLDPNVRRSVGRAGLRTPEAQDFGNRVIREIEEPGSTNDKDAGWAARQILEQKEVVRRWFSGINIDIPRLKDGQGHFPHSHDEWRIIRADKADWASFIREKLDTEKTFPGKSEAEIGEYLDDLYDRITTGRDKDLGLDNEAMETRIGIAKASRPSGGTGNLADRMIQERHLIFKDSKSWVEYNDRFGRGSVMDAITNEMETMARYFGIINQFGDNPSAMLRRLRDAELKRTDADPEMSNREKKRTRQQLRGIEDWPAWRALTGASEIDAGWRFAGKADWADVGTGVRQWINMSTMTAAFLSHFATGPMQSAMVATHHGTPLLQAVFNRFGSAVSKLGKSDKDVAHALGGFADGFSHHAIGPYSAADTFLGGVSRWAAASHTIQGMGFLPDHIRAGAAAGFSRLIAAHGEEAFDKLPPRLRNVMVMNGIGAKEWDVIRSTRYQTPEGHWLVSPQALGELPDEKVDPLIRDRLDTVHQAAQDRIAQLDSADAREASWVEKRRDRLTEKLHAANDRLRAFANSLQGKRGARIEEIEARAELMRARSEQAQVLSEIGAAKTGMAGRQRVEDTIRGLAEGAATAGREAVERASASGERGGRTAGKAETTAADLQKRIASIGPAKDKANATDLAAVEKRVADRRAELKGKLSATDQEFLEKWDARDARLSARGDEVEQYARKQLEKPNVSDADRARARDALQRHAERLEKHVSQLEAAKEKLEAKRAKAEERLAKEEAAAKEAGETRVAKREDGATAAVELLEDRLEAARQRASDAEGLMRRQADRLGVKLEEAITSKGEKVATSAGRTFERGASAAYGAGHKTGYRVAKAEARVRELEKSGGRIVDETDKAIETEGKRVSEMLQRRDDELRDFIATMDERRNTRADERSAIPERVAKRIERLRGEARVQLELAYRRMHANEMSSVIIDSNDPRVRKMVTLGTQRGTPLGELTRSFGLAHGYAIGLAFNGLERHLMGNPDAGSLGQSLLRNKGHIAAYLTAMTLSGLLTIYAKSISRGELPSLTDKDGNPNWGLITEAFAAGGGAGIYADYLFSQGMSQGGLAEKLGGPVINKAYQLSALVASGLALIKKKPGPKKTKSERSLERRTLNYLWGLVPGSNLWYARGVMNWAVLDGIREYLDPGYLARHERAMKRTTGESSFLR